MKKAVVLLSGGLDSTTVLGIAKNLGYEIYALSFDYGQRHEVELESAKKVAEFYQVKEHKIAKIDLRIFGGSALTDEIAVPKKNSLSCNPLPTLCHPEHSEGSQEPDSQPFSQDPSASPQDDRNKSSTDTSIPITYVPARNTIFLSYALAYAETIKAFDIFIGVNAVDFSNYPDCRPDFINAFEKLAALATAAGSENQGQFAIHAPLMHWSKQQIIENGLALGVDYSRTHSCYDPVIKDEKTYSCGRCDSCQLRLEGFKAAGKKDPIQYL